MMDCSHAVGGATGNPSFLCRHPLVPPVPGHLLESRERKGTVGQGDEARMAATGTTEVPPLGDAPETGEAAWFEDLQAERTEAVLTVLSGRGTPVPPGGYRPLGQELA